ncbi:hypothetical protein PY546_00385 [Providencia stuartii]|nr:hypothetical protein [Providencia stuartii]
MPSVYAVSASCQKYKRAPPASIATPKGPPSNANPDLRAFTPKLAALAAASGVCDSRRLCFLGLCVCY